MSAFDFKKYSELVPYQHKVPWAEVESTSSPLSLDPEINKQNPESRLYPGDIFFYEDSVDVFGKSGFLHSHCGLCADRVIQSSVLNDRNNIPLVSVIPSLECFGNGCGPNYTVAHTFEAYSPKPSSLLRQKSLRVLRFRDEDLRRKVVAEFTALSKALEKKSQQHADYDWAYNRDDAVSSIRAIVFGLLQGRCIASDIDEAFFQSVIQLFNSESQRIVEQHVSELFFCSYYVVALLQAALYVTFHKQYQNVNDALRGTYSYAPMIAKSCAPSSVFWTLYHSGHFTCHKLSNITVSSSTERLLGKYDPLYPDKERAPFHLYRAVIELISMILHNNDKKGVPAELFESELCLIARYHCSLLESGNWGRLSEDDEKTVSYHVKHTYTPVFQKYYSTFLPSNWRKSDNVKNITEVCKMLVDYKLEFWKLENKVTEQQLELIRTETVSSLLACLGLVERLASKRKTF